MPFFGLGLHFLVALYFAIHAMRTGQQMYWLFILFSFPLLGSVVYFFVIYLPDSRLERGGRKMVSAAVKALDPTRELREAHDAFEYTPTAQNQMRLAAAQLDAGQPQEAAASYEACLKGPFASDPEIRLGAARAFIACGRFDAAIGHLQSIRANEPNFRGEDLSLLLAQALAGAGRSNEARAEFDSAVARFGSFAAMAEFAIWAADTGDRTTATTLKAQIDEATKRWNRHNRELNAERLKRLSAAFAKLARAN